MLPYKNPELPIEERLDDLIGRMTLDELIMQIDQYNSNEFGVFTDGKDSLDYYDFDKLPELFRGHSVGSVGAWRMDAKLTNRLQRYAVEQTRLGIPMLFCEEGLHGFASKECTSFPQQICMASSFDPSLGRAMGHAIATEGRAKGLH